MHFLLHFLARELSPSLMRRRVVFQIVVAVVVGAGLGTWLAFEVPDGRQYLVQCMAGGMAVGFILSLVLVLKDTISNAKGAQDDAERIAEMAAKNGLQDRMEVGM